MRHSNRKAAVEMQARAPTVRFIKSILRTLQKLDGDTDSKPISVGADVYGAFMEKMDRYAETVLRPAGENTQSRGAVRTSADDVKRAIAATGDFGSQWPTGIYKV